MDERLEEVVRELQGIKDDQVPVADLYGNGYEPFHQSMRKTIGVYQICYRECERSGLFEFGALIKLPVEMRKDDKNQGQLFEEGQ